MNVNADKEMLFVLYIQKNKFYIASHTNSYKLCLFFFAKLTKHMGIIVCNKIHG